MSLIDAAAFVAPEHKLEEEVRASLLERQVTDIGYVQQTRDEMEVLFTFLA